MPHHRPHRRRLPAAAALGAAVLLLTLGTQTVGSPPAAAVVTHVDGFHATVDGFTSWYGSYGMGPIGTAYCIDHGLRAPDPAYRYAPTDLSAVPRDTSVAMAWALAAHARSSSPLRSAAMMLVLHDLMGARYPSGRLDVDRLAPSRLAGFGGQEAALLTEARLIKADAIAHAHLRSPLSLTLTAETTAAGGRGTVTARVVDAVGHPVAGLPIRFGAGSATLDAGAATSTADGTARVGFTGGPGENGFGANATAPDLRLAAFGSTTIAAQRVARPGVVELAASAAYEAPVPVGTVVIVKHGDAEPYAPITGARFRIGNQEVTIGADGHSPATELPAGEHEVVETAPPDGYQPAGPWTVTVRPSEVTTLEVTDKATPGVLTIRKLDGTTGEPLAGAGLHLAYDANHDGSFESDIADVTSTVAGVRLDGLRPGDYQLVELVAPGGYVRNDNPVRVHVRPGATTEAALVNQPAATAVGPPTTTTTTSTTSTTSTTLPAATTSTTALPRVPRALVAPAPSLPRTGGELASLAAIGAGLLLLGGAAVIAARRPLSG